MPVWKRTYREVDGQRVEGTWRPAFIRNGDYFLTDLIVYADGLIDCWGLVTLDEFRAMAASGRLAATLPAGARVSMLHLTSWRPTEDIPLIDVDDLVGEVIDEIERLAGRPTSEDRCLAAVEALRAEPTEERRAELARAYEAVPRHLRPYLGGMDTRDYPILVLSTPVGEPLGDRAVTAADHEEAFASLQPPGVDPQLVQKLRSLDQQEMPSGSTVNVNQRVFRRGWPDPPGITALQPDYPAPIEIDGIRYPSLHHAFWARSVAHRTDHDRIVAEPNPGQVRRAAQEAGPRPGWHAVQLAEMGDLLRAKFRQHPALASILLSTGDGPILYHEVGSPFWASGGSTGGRNWYGRLLEVVRAELAAAVTPPPPPGRR